MESPDTFHLVPLTIDPATKALSSSDKSFTREIEDLNKYHKLMLAIENPAQVPGPPAPVNPKRSVNISKLRESGNNEYRKGKFPEAVKFYDLALKMAEGRPPWEASGLVREEFCALYNNRAQAYMSQQMWPEASVDAEISVEMKRVGNVKACWRRGVCLKEMGRIDEAREWIRGGLEFEKAGPDKQGVGELEALAKEVDELLARSS